MTSDGGSKAASQNVNRFTSLKNPASTAPNSPAPSVLKSQSMIEDSGSPFYISNSDRLGTNLVSHPLDGGNYNFGSRGMIMALTAKNEMYFVDGSVLRPNLGDSIYSSWIRCNSLICS